jgi:sugar-specific transcriptional regulator TrmB/DNA-binding CsgD family transcriptional regulator
VLTSLGLDSAAEAVYKEMLKAPTSSAADIADRLGWPEPRVTAAMQELARLLLVRPSWQEPDAFRPVDPEVGLRHLLDRQEAELQRRLEEIERGRRELLELVAEFADLNRTRQHPKVEMLVGIDAIRFRIESLATNCTDEVLVFVPSSSMSPANISASRPLDRGVLDRGVRLRSIYLESIRNDNDTSRYVDWLTGGGAQVRVAATLPPRMVIYDRSTAIVPVDPNKTYEGALMLCGAGVVSALCELFERVWQSSRPLNEPPSPEGYGNEKYIRLNDRSQAIIVLLSRGYTDESIARRLGVSVRTVRRETAGLTSQLGAKTRFQAGALALSQGWVDPGLLG